MKPWTSLPVQRTEKRHTGVLSNSTVWVFHAATTDWGLLHGSCTSHPSGLWRKGPGSEGQPLSLLLASLHISSHGRTLSSSVHPSWCHSLYFHPQASGLVSSGIYLPWGLTNGSRNYSTILGPNQHGGARRESCHFWGGGRRIQSSKSGFGYIVWGQCDPQQKSPTKPTHLKTMLKILGLFRYI